MPFKPPVAHGQSIRQAAAAGEVFPKMGMGTGSADRLSVFEEFRFFSPAILYLYGGVTDHVLFDVAATGVDLVVLHRLFRRPVFRGLVAPNGDAEWNHALWAVPASQWEALENYLLSVATINRDRRAVCRVGAQDLVVADPLFLEKHALVHDAPLLPVTVFGVDGTFGTYSMGVGADPRTVTPVLTRGRPSQRILRLAKSALDDDNPVDPDQEPS